LKIDHASNSITNDGWRRYFPDVQWVPRPNRIIGTRLSPFPRDADPAPDERTSVKKLLMVGAGVMGRGYVDAARRMGVGVELIDLPSRRAGYAPIVEEFHESPDPAEETWIAVALDVAAKCRPTGVLAFSEPQVLAAAWAQHTLGLPGPSLPAALASRDKALQRTLLRRHDVGQPEFHIVGPLDPTPAFDWAASRYPVVAKPLRSFGSLGVRLVPDRAALRALLTDRWPDEPVLIETYVDAPEYSWEALIQRGEVRFGSYTRKQTSGPPQFVELGHVLPHDFGPQRRDLLDAVMRRAVAALGIDSALVHLEFRFDGSRVDVLEAAVRTPGDHLMDLLALAYGCDFFELTVRLALGEPLAELPAAVAQAAIGFVTSAPGVIRSVDGLDAARAVPGVVRASADLPEGTTVAGLESSADRVGHVVAVRTGADAWEAVEAARAAITVSVGQPEPAEASS
jgi:biotin carboxylase